MSAIIQQTCTIPLLNYVSSRNTGTQCTKILTMQKKTLKKGETSKKNPPKTKKPKKPKQTPNLQTKAFYILSSKISTYFKYKNNCPEGMLSSTEKYTLHTCTFPSQAPWERHT